MNALDTLINIINTNNLYNANLKYCLVGYDKTPFKLNGEHVKPNNINDFIEIDNIINFDKLDKYAGLGISIQASNICAIDVDDCFTNKFDITSADNRAKDIIEIFKDLAYIEFSFSGHGLRILFRQDNIDDYTQKYYIKNDDVSIEYYQPEQSYRYVTITGKVIYNNKIDSNRDFKNIIISFLDKYMKRKIKKKEIIEIEDNKNINELMKEVKKQYFKNYTFQNIWFSKAPGSGKDESEKDFYLLSYIYENITQNKEKLKYIFEQSPFFKSKDYYHINKWTKQNYRYFEYLYEQIRRK